MSTCKCNPPHALSPEERAKAEGLVRNSYGVDNTAFMFGEARARVLSDRGGLADRTVARERAALSKEDTVNPRKRPAMAFLCAACAACVPLDFTYAVCTGCGAPFEIADEAGDGASFEARALPEGADGAEAAPDVRQAIDASHLEASTDGSPIDVAIAPPEVGAPEIGAGDGPAVCGYSAPTYFSLGASCAEAPSDAGISTPGTFLLQIGTAGPCVGVDTPAACQCAGAYTCACMLPALWALQSAQQSHDAAGMICAGTIEGCIVDALGVIRVHCE